MGDVINLDGDVATNNAGKLQQTVGELPDAQAIRQVEGNRTEPAPASYTSRLRTVSSGLGDRVERIRKFVAENADALNNAVNTLRETDRMTADAARQATALIDDVVAGPGGSVQSRTAGDFAV
jgi:hypothetical protein